MRDRETIALLVRLVDEVSELSSRTREMARIIRSIKRLEIVMSGELQALKDQVTRVTQVDQAAVALLQGLKQKLDDAIASGDPAALTALSTELGNDSDGLAAAITANTPADGGGTQTGG